MLYLVCLVCCPFIQSPSLLLLEIGCIISEKVNRIYLHNPNNRIFQHIRISNLLFEIANSNYYDRFLVKTNCCQRSTYHFSNLVFIGYCNKMQPSLYCLLLMLIIVIIIIIIIIIMFIIIIIIITFVKHNMQNYRLQRR